MNPQICCKCESEAVVCCEDGEWRCYNCAVEDNFNPDTGEVEYPETEDEYFRGGRK